MRTSKLEYTSFLVRLWREPPASVEPPAADREWLVQAVGDGGKGAGEQRAKPAEKQRITMGTPNP